MGEYKLIIFDADGTLTPLRGGELGDFVYELLPGVKEKCDELSGKCIEIAIASNQNAKRRRKDIVKQLSWTKKAVGAKTFVYADGIKFEHKPSPDMLLHLLRVFGIDKSQALFVGDWGTDMLAAQRAGIDFAWAEDFFCDQQADDSE